MSFSVPGSHPGYHFTFSNPVSLGSARQFCFYQTFFVLMALTVLRNAGQEIGRMSFNWDVSDVFLMVRLGL